MAIIVREWEEGDLPGIQALLGELAWHLHYNFTFEAERLASQFREMHEKPQEYRSYVCAEDGEILGFVSAVFYVSVFHCRGTALVNELVVKDGCRGRGIGSTLMRTVEDEARHRGMDEIEVGVENENLTAQDFYRKAGLTEEYLLLGKDFG